MPDSASEAERLLALERYGAKEAVPAAVLDSLVRLAARLCDAPVGRVTLVDEARQVFEAQMGYDGPPAAPLDVGFCPIVVARGKPVVIPDTLADPAHADNPAARDDGVRFYAGVPLLADGEHILGTLCVLDTAPRPAGLTQMQMDVLVTLSTQVVSQFELRRSLAQRDALLAEQRASMRERDALARVQAAIGAADGDLDTILAALVSNAMDAVPTADGGVLELIDGDALEYRAVRGALEPHKGLRVPLLGSLAGSCAATNEPILVDDVRSDGRVVRELVERLNLRAAVLAPVARAGQALGVLKLQSSTPGAFGLRDLQVVRLFAGVATAGLTEVVTAEARHEAGKALREAELALHRAQAAVGVGAFSVDVRDNMLKPTPEFCRIYGVPVRDVLPPEEIQRLVLPEHDGLVSDAAARAAGEISTDVEYCIRRPDTGEVRWIWRRAEIERDDAGTPVRFFGVARDVTERRLAADALARSEQRYRALFEAIDDGFCIIEFLDGPHGPASDYVHVEANLGYERHTGIPNIVGRTLRDLAPDEADGWAELYGGVLRTGQPVRFERHFAMAGRHIEVSAARIEPESRRQVSVLFRDITARKQAEAALRASDALVRETADRVQLALAAGAIIGTWFWDIPTDRFKVDEGFARSFGLDPALGRDGLSLEQVVATVHPADKPALAAAIEEAIARGRAYAHQYRVRRADGKYYWIEASGRVDYGPDGRPLSFPGVLVDVEERRSIEGERDRALAELRALTETLEQRVEQRTRELHDARDFTRLALASVGGVGAWTYEAASDHFFCSGAVAELYGLDPVRAEHGIDRVAFTANVHAEDKAALAAIMAGGLEKPGDLELEYRIHHRDGSIRWVLSRGYTYHENGRPVRRVGIAVDTTRQHQLEEQLRQSQKMEAVGQLTGGLAHDFNNLLTGVTGSLELMQTRIAQGRIKDVDRYVNAAQGAAKRAAALTHRLLAFSRRQTLDPKPTNVNQLVRGMEDLIRRTVGPAIMVEPAVSATGLWSTLVDPGQLENALLNLCINARDAMPDGGKITIETGNRWLDERTARLQDLEPGQYVSLCVSDTGTGMPPEVVAKAFDPFFTTKPIGQGTGLGLSMIYGFAKQSGGQVRIYSEVGQGTTVCLYLPRHLGEAETAELAPELVDAPRAQQGETVLVVDDEPTVRMLVTEVLEDLGYRAIEAADGAAGLQVLHSDVRIDLLVTDVGLPGGMNGRQVADAARVARPDLKVLFITGYAENAVLSHGHLDPGMHVLTKPFALEALASRIKDLILH